MNKDKQIEEMAKDLCNSTMCDLETFNNCRMPRGNCSRCQRVAEDLYNAGYRKASDVVREMQERIKAEKFHCMNFGNLVYLADIDRIAKEMLEGIE